MKAVIHQPYFLPWLGYFSKLVYADKFIVLDNVEFSKRHFIDRTQVINAEGELIWVGMNIGERYKVKCNEILFEDNKRIETIIKTFHSAYTKARHFKTTISYIENILTSSFSKSNRITDINLQIIVKLIELLELNRPDIILASQFEENQNATERVISLMQNNKCNTLITGSGGSLDKHDTDKINSVGIEIHLQDYYKLHPTYYQTRRTKLGFAKGLSIVDCIFNEGLQKTKELLFDKNCEPTIYK
jgi:WbqC-like protein family